MEQLTASCSWRQLAPQTSHATTLCCRSSVTTSHGPDVWVSGEKEAHKMVVTEKVCTLLALLRKDEAASYVRTGTRALHVMRLREYETAPVEQVRISFFFFLVMLHGPGKRMILICWCGEHVGSRISDILARCWIRDNCSCSINKSWTRPKQLLMTLGNTVRPWKNSTNSEGNLLGLVDTKGKGKKTAVRQCILVLHTSLLGEAAYRWSAADENH